MVGQETLVDRLLVGLLSNGHILLEGVPGLAKTLTVNALAGCLSAKFARVQFTPDLLPADLIGTLIYNPQDGEFLPKLGPIFANLVLADEINRAPAKVQSALLEAMQERRVTIGNDAFALPAPFLVIATQNPIEQSGTFELPEAQLDRFMLCHRLDYPSANEEESVLNNYLKLGLKREEKGAVPQTAFDMVTGDAVADLDTLVQVMSEVQKVHVSEVFVKHCVEAVRRTRHHEKIELGASPRAGIALVQAARARAFIHGRNYVIPEDLFALAEDVILHRIRLTYEALADGLSGLDVLNEILLEFQ